MSKLILLLLLIPTFAFAQFNNEQKSNAINLIPQVKNELDYKLTDYTTARFKDVYATIYSVDNKDYYGFCGLINYQSTAGGYTGWQTFAVTEGNYGKMKVLLLRHNSFDDIVRGMCEQTGNKIFDNEDLSARFYYTK